MYSDEWFYFFRNKRKWVCINDDPDWLKKHDGYFTYGKIYDLDYLDYENEDVYLILDNGRDDSPIDFNDLINNFETLEDFRDIKLKLIGI
jgi:hypothetical protein